MSAAKVPQLLDVTLRDGGYVNEWKFPLPMAVKIVSNLAAAGIKHIEVGYYLPREAGSASPMFGPGCCPGAYLDAVSRAAGSSELSVMVHLQNISLDDYTFLKDHGVSRVRFVIPTEAMPSIEPHIRAVHRSGLFCSVNLIRLSQRPLESLITCARMGEGMGADWLYLADSNGSMFPEQVEKSFQHVTSAVKLPVGFHAHDSLRLAFANTLAAVRGGCQLLDSSLAGMGKGAGNLVTELITAYLKTNYHVQFDITRLATVSSETLGAWISQDHQQRCESALSALLDLNADSLKERILAAKFVQRPFLSELERCLDQLTPQPAERHIV